MDELKEMARLHSAGAIVRYPSPFRDLPTHTTGQQLSQEFIDKWVIPFYRDINWYETQDWIEAIALLKPEITPEICLALLGDFNWRTRLVGAYFSAVQGYREHTDIIGVHLLQSQTCCVGHIYAQVLAFFNDEPSRQYLTRYLAYYLTRPDLYYDQAAVMKAVLYLDEINGTAWFGSYLEPWRVLEAAREVSQKEDAQRFAAMLERSRSPQEAEDYLRTWHKDYEAAKAEEAGENAGFATEDLAAEMADLHYLHHYGRAGLQSLVHRLVVRGDGLQGVALGCADILEAGTGVLAASTGNRGLHQGNGVTADCSHRVSSRDHLR